MNKYQFTDDMGEISGFGGDYEEGCRKMLIAGLEWVDKYPEAIPRFSTYTGVYGVVNEDNQYAKDLTTTMYEVCPGCTGAMMQACVSHVLYIKKNGWGAYAQEMKIKKAK